MPWIVPFIPLIAAGGSLAGAGVAAYDANNSSIDQTNAQKANQQALDASQKAQANQAALTKQQAILGAQGQEQAQTGGSLTDSGTASLTDLLAGYPGYSAPGGTSPNTTPSVGTGIAPSGVPGSGTSSGTPDIAALLATLRNGTSGGGFGTGGDTISGGNWQTQPPPPQQGFQLSNPVLG